MLRAQLLLHDDEPEPGRAKRAPERAAVEAGARQYDHRGPRAARIRAGGLP